MNTSSSQTSNKENTSLLVQNGDEDWVDTMVSCAQAVNKMFVRNTCRLCQVYTDRQVEFEVQQQQNPVERAFLKAALAQPEVEIYRQFLFDEESVVGGLPGYDDEDDEEEQPQEQHQDDSRTVGTQRTH